MKIYCAGPITGQTGNQVFDYYDDLRETLFEAGYEVLCPMTGKDHMRTETNFTASFSDDGEFPMVTDKSIFDRDKWMVRQSDIVYANFTRGHDKVSIGTVMEMAFAHEMGKLVIAVIPNGNIHNHAFVSQAATTVFTNTEDALLYLELLARG